MVICAEHHYQYAIGCDIGEVVLLLKHVIDVLQSGYPCVCLSVSAQITVSNIMFAGVNLKVIIGHPEHDLLFIAKQVADNAGLCDASNAVSRFLKLKTTKVQLKVNDLSVLAGAHDTLESIIEFPKIQGRSSLFTEAQVYDFLFWSRAPKAEPFRKWVTEEVLPTIRKTGRYDITESNTAEAKQFSEEFAMLADMMKALGDRMASLETLMQKSVQGCRVLAQVSSVGA